MKVNFDLFKKRRIPSLILCNPNGRELASMPLAKDRQLSMSLNELSELTFTLSKPINKEEIMPYYDMVVARRVVKLEDIGQFLITKVEVDSDGTEEIKKVTCKGLEFELSSRNIGILQGTYNFYDPTNTTKSLLHILLSYLPTWTIESIDSELWNIYRTFDIQDNNIYNFMMGEVSEAYDCVFLFDTFNRKIKAVKTSNISKKTDIYMSSRNLMNELSITEDSDNIITALDVYGDEDLSIRTVNPLGRPTIYDFSYFMTEEWMSVDLIQALLNWQNKIKNAESEYADLLVKYKNEDKVLLSLNSDLVNLEREKKEIEQMQELAVVAKDDESCSRYAKQIEQKELDINIKKTQILSKEEELSVINNSLLRITESLSFESNFTSSQLMELDPFIYQYSIQNTNYSLTDLTTIEEQQSMMFDLYNWGKSELRKSCQPTWSFSIGAINFLNLVEYKNYIDQFDLGSEIIIEVDKTRDLYATALLLSYSIDLDDFDDLDLKFASELKFNSGSWTFEELFDSTASINKSFNFESNSWSKGKEAYSIIDDYIHSALDLTNQEIKATDNQEFVISNVGLRGREFDPNTGTYLKEQIWMTKNILAFSDDGFNTVKTALGKITLPDGSKSYGLIGEYIVGKVLCGKSLILENENSSFRVDGNGVYIKNSNLILTDGTGQGNKTMEEIIGMTNQKIEANTNNINTTNNNLEEAKKSLGDKLTATSKKIDTTKGEIDRVFNTILTNNGLLDTSKLAGQILAGQNNIFCVNLALNKALIVNENGMLISNSKTNGVWDWKTAITGDGIVADVIRANSTLAGVHIVGGDIAIGTNNAFYVDVNGNVKISRGSIDINNGAFRVDSSGTMTMTKGSINIGDKAFYVDQYGNVSANSLKLQLQDNSLVGSIDFSNLVVKNLVVGNNVSMGSNATITWSQVTNKDDVANKWDISWDNLRNKPEIPYVPSYINSTYIGRTEIQSPTITGNVVNSATFNGGVYRTWDNGVYGGQLDSYGIHVYSGNTQIGDFCYTNDNVYGNRNAVLLNSKNGYALKISSSGNMSIESRDILYLSGLKISFTGSNLVFDGCETSGLVARFG